MALPALRKKNEVEPEQFLEVHPGPPGEVQFMDGGGRVVIKASAELVVTDHE